MSISRLWHINIPIVVQDITIGELIEGYMGSLCIISNNCICIYSYLKIRSTKQNKTFPQRKLQAQMVSMMKSTKHLRKK